MSSPSSSASSRPSVLRSAAVVAAATLLLAATSTASAADSKTLVRGVRRRDQHLYTAPTFTCRDGALTVDGTQVNDDFCDCADGSDEPGTSACNNGKFYCRNKGHTALLMPSSRVGDGLCDCCDGTDEADGVCENTCAQMGATTLQEDIATIAAIKSGLTARAAMAKEAAAIAQERALKLVDVEEQCTEMEAQVAKMDEMLVKLEAREAEERAVRETAWQLEHAPPPSSAPTDGADGDASAAASTEPPAATDAADGGASADAASTESGSGDGEAAAAAAAADDTGAAGSAFPYPAEYAFLDKGGDGDAAAGATDGGDDDDDDDEPCVGDDCYEEVECTEGVDCDQDDDDDDEAAADAPRHVFPGYTDQEAEDTRRFKQTVVDKLQAAQKERESLTTLMSENWGADNVFAVLHNECFSLEVDKYTYEVCPYGKATQKEGGTGTDLGSWKGWSVDDKRPNAPHVMKFSGGAKCWNGPERSATVVTRCAARHELVSVDEPSKCVYEFVFGTPCVCDESLAETLQAKVDRAQAMGDDDDEDAVEVLIG